MRRTLLLLVATAVLAPAGEAAAAPKIVYVSTTGADHRDLRRDRGDRMPDDHKAVALAVNGDTVKVGPGELGVEEPPSGGGIAIKKQITLLGAQAGVDPRDPTVRTPGGPDETVVFDSNPATKAGALIVAATAPNVTVDGFTFTGSALGSGLQVGNEDHRLGGYRVVNNIF